VEPIEVRSLAELGAAIRRIRRARGWTQSELADWIGSNRFTVHRLERGGATGMPVVLRAIATLGYSAVLVPRKAPSSTEGDRVVREPRG
jgi:transcriptional regulator with XRE-family HTH domain